MWQIDRTNTSLLGRWWWTVDRFTLTLFGGLMLMGVLLVMAGSPPVAERLDLPAQYFSHRHIGFVLVSGLAMLGVSLLPVRWILAMSALGVMVGLVLMVGVLLIGEEAKGAARWLYIGGMSIQPSEFVKPCFVVLCAWLFSEHYKQRGFPGHWLATGLFLLTAFLLVLQPDIGMTALLSAVWAAQFFLAGLPLVVLVLLGVLAIAALGGAYWLFPHVTQRVDSFFKPDGAGNYQVEKSLEAFRNGGWLGTGPGDGTVKRHLPDSHTDFIFAVAGEELGVIACILIMSVIVAIVIRGAMRVWAERDLFVLLAAGGLLILFGLQSMINIGVSLHLLPTKGMTLPLISYGGSSMLAYGLAAGMLLGLTRQRYGRERYGVHYEPAL